MNSSVFHHYIHWLCCFLCSPIIRFLSPNPLFPFVYPHFPPSISPCIPPLMVMYNWNLLKGFAVGGEHNCQHFLLCWLCVPLPWQTPNDSFKLKHCQLLMLVCCCVHFYIYILIIECKKTIVKFQTGKNQKMVVGKKKWCPCFVPYEQWNCTTDLKPLLPEEE